MSLEGRDRSSHLAPMPLFLRAGPMAADGPGFAIELAALVKNGILREPRPWLFGGFDAEAAVPVVME